MLHETSPQSQPPGESKSFLLPSVSGRAPPSVMEEEPDNLSSKTENQPQCFLSASRVSSDSKYSTPKLHRPANRHPEEHSGPQLIGGLPCAKQNAMKIFQEISENWYQHGSLGRSRQQEDSMMCECQYEHGDDPTQACGDQSDCINRLTQVECLADECRCRSNCQNQRFQMKQYSKIDIVQTEKKGFGLRAAEDIAKDSFVYEYIGEVINQLSFIKRMRQYAEEGIRHFYFMMLQRDEFIDATKKGGIGRFANHSCNPNCYVAKWVVGQRVRMGIFAKRFIKRGEEITFNYNVDRYGHDPQPCYCGEPKCVGFIGGKTQTDLSGMDDLYIDALGIADEVEELSLKGSKRRRAKKLGKDFIPVLKPMLEKDVSTVVNAARQTTSRKILYQLLTRIKITEDQAVLRQITRLRGLSLMSTLLIDYPDDEELATLIMQSISAWPLVNRNKVEDSQIERLIKTFSQSSNETMKAMSNQLLSQWSQLECVYRIPKRSALDADEKEFDTVRPKIILAQDDFRPTKRQRLEEEVPSLALKPMGYRPQLPLSTPAHPHATNLPLQTSLPRFQPSRTELAEIIAKAAAMQAQLPVPVISSVPPSPNLASLPRKTDKRHRPNGEPSKPKGSSCKNKEVAKTTKEVAKEGNKEKRLLKLVGAVVVKCMSKYKDQLDHEVFKQNAKDLTTLIVDKEKKSSSYTTKLDSLSEDKQAKIKKFVKTYIAKVLKKIRDKESRWPPSKPVSAPKDKLKNDIRNGPSSRDTVQTRGISDYGGQVDMDGRTVGDDDTEAVSSVVSDILGDDLAQPEVGMDDDPPNDLGSSSVPVESLETNDLGISDCNKMGQDLND